MVSFGYNTSAMAQRYFSVDDERSARKVAMLCCGLFFLGAFLWFIPPMAMRVIYPDLHSVWPSLANASEASYAVASLTLLPHGLIGIMLAAMFSATMASLSGMFNVKVGNPFEGHLPETVSQECRRARTAARGLDRNLITWRVDDDYLQWSWPLSGQTVFGVMLKFNTLISLAYGPPALLGLVVRRTPPWSGLASFATGLILECLGAFVYDWSLIQQVVIIIPASFGIFFFSMLFDRGDTPARAQLFKNLNTPVDIAVELKDSPDFTAPVFRFLSRTISAIGLSESVCC